MQSISERQINHVSECDSEVAGVAPIVPKHNFDTWGLAVCPGVDGSAPRRSLLRLSASSYCSTRFAHMSIVPSCVDVVRVVVPLPDVARAAVGFSVVTSNRRRLKSLASLPLDVACRPDNYYSYVRLAFFLVDVAGCLFSCGFVPCGRYSHGSFLSIVNSELIPIAWYSAL